MDFSLYDALEEKDQLKFVIADGADYEYARGVMAKRRIRASIIFQPVYGTKADWIAERACGTAWKT